MTKRKRTATQASPRRRIFLVEDHPAFRQGMIHILEQEDDLKVCGSAGTVAKALPAIARLRPDLVLVDISLPGKSGLELIKLIRKKDRKVKLLVLSMHDKALYADRVLRAGGDGYVMKEEDPDEILHAVRDVLAGHIYVSDDVFSNVGKGPDTAGKRPAFDQLSDVDLEILAMLGKGASAGEAARRLRLPLAQVKHQCAGMRKTLKLKSDNALVRFAVCWVETGTI